MASFVADGALWRLAWREFQDGDFEAALPRLERLVEIEKDPIGALRRRAAATKNSDAVAELEAARSGVRSRSCVGAPPVGRVDRGVHASAVRWIRWVVAAAAGEHQCGEEGHNTKRRDAHPNIVHDPGEGGECVTTM